MAVRTVVKPPEDKLIQARCVGCGATLEFLKSDAKITYFPREGTLGYVDCPNCQRKVYVSESLLGKGCNGTG